MDAVVRKTLSTVESTPPQETRGEDGPVPEAGLAADIFHAVRHGWLSLFAVHGWTSLMPANGPAPRDRCKSSMPCASRVT
jgi:hypothetical protein